MKIDNSLYGGFVVSKNVLNGIPIRYSYREKSNIKELNGWTIYSDIDDDEYVSDSNNFVIVTAETLFEKVQVIKEIFDAPYGTDLCWLYEEGVHTGFYDLKNDKEVTIEQINKGF